MDLLRDVANFLPEDFHGYRCTTTKSIENLKQIATQTFSIVSSMLYNTLKVLRNPLAEKHRKFHIYIMHV